MLPYIFLFIIGIIFGSFYNVVGTRIPNGESIIKPRSHCTNCNHVLKWYELIPIISYFVQLGKCRNCKKPISIFYPFIEIVTGLLFAVSFYSFGFSYELIICLLLVSFFSIVIVSDLNYMVIPDEVTITISILIIIVNFLNLGFYGGILKIFSGIITFLGMYLIMILGNIIFKKETLGGADVKLMFIAGLTLHPLLGIFVIFIASSIALPASILIYVTSRDHMIPFGPFLVASILLFYLLKIDISTFLNLF